MNEILPKITSQPEKIIIYKETGTKVKSIPEQEISNDSSSEEVEPTIENEETPIEKKVKALRKRDINAVENNFKAPKRRLPRHAYPERSVRKLINVPTRGYPDDYHNVGMLVRKNDEKILKLFGRQKYPGSSQWEYYVLGNDPNGLNSKIPLENPGHRELFDKDTIDLPWLDQSKGKFQIKLFDYDAPRYNPYVF